MNYLKYLFIGLIFFANRSYSQTDTLYTLPQCIDIAIKNNLDVKQSELKMEQDRIYWKQARENLLPTINSDLSQGTSSGQSLNPLTNTYISQSIGFGNYSLNAGLILFNGLALQSSIKQTSLAYQAGKMDFEQAKNTITLNVITAYLQVLDNTDLLAQAKGQLTVTQKELDRLDVLFKDGATNPGDYYNVKGQLGTDQLNVINAGNALIASKLNLLQIMNVPFSKNVQIERLKADEVPGEYNTTVDQVYTNAIATLPLVKAAAYRTQSARKEVQAAKGSLWPTLSLNGGLSTRYSSTAHKSIFVDSSTVTTGGYIKTPTGNQPVYTSIPNYNYQNISFSDQFRNNYTSQVYLGLHIPILNSFTYRNKVSLAKIDYLNAKYVEQTARVQLKQNVEQAYNNMTSAYSRYQVLLQQVNAYAESFRTVEIRFKAGVLNSYDYILAKNNLDQSNTNLIIARYDYFIRTKILDYYQGRLSF